VQSVALLYSGDVLDRNCIPTLPADRPLFGTPRGSVQNRLPQLDDRNSRYTTRLLLRPRSSVPMSALP